MLRNCQKSYGIRGGIINRHEGDVSPSMKNAERACQDEGICIVFESIAASFGNSSEHFLVSPAGF
jgi:hypothetical protein